MAANIRAVRDRMTVAPLLTRAGKSSRHCHKRPCVGQIPSSVLLFTNDLYNRANETLKFIRRNRERRREIDDIADRSHEHAQFDKSPAHRIEITNSIQLHDADGAHDANILDTPQPTAWLKTLG